VIDREVRTDRDQYSARDSGNLRDRIARAARLARATGHAIDAIPVADSILVSVHLASVILREINLEEIVVVLGLTWPVDDVWPLARTPDFERPKRGSDRASERERHGHAVNRHAGAARAGGLRVGQTKGHKPTAATKAFILGGIILSAFM
jgi:hypothetical protein